MIWLAQFAGTMIGRLWIIGGGLAALVIAYKSIEYKGVQKERARVVEQARKTDAKAQPARRAAERDSRRVLERYTRD
jgi:hypothetical protein